VDAAGGPEAPAGTASPYAARPDLARSAGATPANQEASAIAASVAPDMADVTATLGDCQAISRPDPACDGASRGYPPRSVVRALAWRGAGEQTPVEDVISGDEVRSAVANQELEVLEPLIVCAGGVSGQITLPQSRTG